MQQCTGDLDAAHLAARQLAHCVACAVGPASERRGAGLAGIALAAAVRTASAAAPAPLAGAADTGLIGRDSELSRLRGLVDPPPAESRVLVLLGDAGMGKTVLLAEAAREARSAGLRVLQVAGRESERDLAFAGLHQLLRPVLDRVASLPDRQAEALLGAFGLSAEPAPAGALLTGLAVLTLLSNLCEDRPLLLVADDAQWMDRGSLDTLAFAARRMEAEPLVLLLGTRGNLPPAGFERDFPELRLEPLGTHPAQQRPRPPP